VTDQRPPRNGLFVRLAHVAAVVSTLALGPALAQNQTPAGPAAAIPADIVVVDRDGRLVPNLRPSNFSVTVDGRARRVLWVRCVSRGPGAADEAALRAVDGSDTLRFASEPARNILLVVDEPSIQRGAERPLQQAAGALVDRLGLRDRMAVIRVPMARDVQLALTTERPAVREALRQVTGQAAIADGVRADRPVVQQQVGGDEANRPVADSNRPTPVERDRTPIAAPVPEREAADGVAPPAGFLQSFRLLLAALGESRGRKSVIVFSAGWPPSSMAMVDEVARIAVAAHATIYGIGLPGARDDSTNALDVGAIERLAKATGGSFTALGKAVDKSLARVLPELSTTYVLGIEREAGDTGTAVRTLRVEVPQRGLTIRAPGWLVPRRDVDDLDLPAASSAAPSSPAPGGAAASAAHAGVRESAAPAPGSSGGVASPLPALSPRDIEVQRLIGKAADYIASYQREYSMLVAEEKYVQRADVKRQELRSDLLLVRPEHSDGWVSFRDVFEVNGQLVRDRDDRLRRLFLDPRADAQTQLNQIKTESARYNIGPIGRNINVPLFAMKFLEDRHLWRCRFTLGGTQEVAGVVSTRIDYAETGRPTLVRHNDTDDIAARGWFLIDAASGALTGSQMSFLFPDESRLEFTVRYGRDATLGLWVPVEMTEVFMRSTGRISDEHVVIDARATYSKFRRFQVTAETDIKIVR